MRCLRLQNLLLFSTRTMRLSTSRTLRSLWFMRLPNEALSSNSVEDGCSSLSNAKVPDYGSDGEAEEVTLDNNLISETRSLWLLRNRIDDTLVQTRKMTYSS
ncbi:hypothetical protein HanLR1_Chr02g0053731 [Helianthus annuus]|nr:hypothetical protein HanHA89_Chr02g0056141 [Helianthus annuus]KAJ0777128.1 hypothetical protein HanLR1_Chr02g0053731 [Helianthus annuus]